MASSTRKVNGQPFTVLIEGNIGSGKTSFINHFKKFDDVCLLTEPVDQWRDCGGINLLELLYKEPYRWAMPFQSYVTLTMLKRHTAETNKSVKLLERSMFSARYCFVENMLKGEILHPGMYKVLTEWYNYFMKTTPIRVDLIVYLRTTPEIVFERMRERGRAEESAISLEYLQELHEHHENWLVKGRHPVPAKVLTINADLDLSEIGAEYQKFETSVLQPIFVENLVQQQAILVSPSKS